MNKLYSLKPANKPRVMDLVEDAGIDIRDWAKSTKGYPAANPKYCYEWSFYQPGKVVVLNLWYEDIQQSEKSIYRNINYRDIASNFSHKPSWYKRSSNADEYVLAAWRDGLPVRVIVCDGIKRSRNDIDTSPSQVEQRMLDSVEWSVTEYNTKTGQATLTRGAKPMPHVIQRVLFARIGYMKYYKGSLAGDEKPIGGGKYNKLYTGHEIFNFKDIKGKLFGYFQPYLKKNEIHRATINLDKIEPGRTGGKTDDVLVIFFSTLPDEGGQVIIGWYKYATAYREYQSSARNHQRDNYNYNIEAVTKNCALLPPDIRKYQIAGKGLKQTGRPGQSNAFYAYDDKGKLKREKWIKKAIEYVENYDGDNLLDINGIESEIQRSGAQQAEKELASSTGQAFNTSAKARKAIEDYSMKKAKKYFIKEGYKFERDTSKNHSYDLEFSKRGKLLYVEVKGTQSDGKSVFLTRNETIHVNNNKNQCALYILHSINLKETRTKCTCSGGKILTINPWSINKDDLKVVTYQYQVPEK